MGSPTPPPPPTPASRASCYSVRLRLHRRRAVAGLRRRPQPRGKMKLMYFLMDEEGEEQRCRAEELRVEVSELEAVLAKEERLSRVLRCSLQPGRGVGSCRCCLSAHLAPAKIRGLLAELAIVEDEIFYLEKKVDDLRARLLRERNWTHHCILQQQQRQRQQDWPPGRHSIGRRELHGGEQLPRLPGPGGGGDGGGLERESKASAGSVSSQGEETDHSRRSSHSFENLRPPERKICSSSPNKLSEELIKLTVTIFHKLSKTTNNADSVLGLSSAPKLNITSCIGSSRSLAPKLSSSSSSDGAAPPIRSVKSRAAAPPECGGDEGEAGGSCNRFVEFTRSSFDSSRVSLCLADIKNLRVLMNKLCTVDPSFLTNKQKLAFWLNIYNFCVMHAFLQHGLPPSPDKLLALLNQASVNVGGRVLSVASIERLFLRHPPDEGNKQGMMMEEGERELQLCYGLGYPEPNVVFALCRGSCSSPPVRVSSTDRHGQLFLAELDMIDDVRSAGPGVHGGGGVERAGGGQGGVPRAVRPRRRREEEEDEVEGRGGGGGHDRAAEAAALAHAVLRRRRGVAAGVGPQPAPARHKGARAQEGHQGTPPPRQASGAGEDGGDRAVRRRLQIPTAPRLLNAYTAAPSTVYCCIRFAYIWCRGVSEYVRTCCCVQLNLILCSYLLGELYSIYIYIYVFLYRNVFYHRL